MSAMSETNENVYKQTYHLNDDGDEEEDENGDSEPDSSEEVQYIQASDLPEDVLERILAAHKSSVESEDSQQIDSCDEESSEEENNYKTKYKVFRDQDSSSEASCNEEDTDCEPKEKRVRRYKTNKKTDKDQDFQNEASFDSDTSEGLKRKNARKTKPCIEVQRTPGAEYIKVPVPNCNDGKFKKAYRKEWEKIACLKDWIQPWLADPMYAYCRFCKCKLVAHKKGLVHHSTTIKHKKNAFDSTGALKRGSSKPVNLTFLTPRSQVQTEEVLLNEYDSSSLSFANSPNFSMRVINDPLLPIS